MKETEIKKQVRERVYERDSWDGAPCCIRCGSPYGIEVHHFIERSRGGKGIEENLVCLCHRCHQQLHSTEDQGTKQFVREYLLNHYKGWREEDLIRRK